MYTYFIAFVGTTADGSPLSRAFRRKKIYPYKLYWVGILRTGHRYIRLCGYTRHKYIIRIYACHDQEIGKTAQSTTRVADKFVRPRAVIVGKSLYLTNGSAHRTCTLHDALLKVHVYEVRFKSRLANTFRGRYTRVCCLRLDI